MGTLVCTKFNIDYNDISLTTLLQNKQSGTAPVLSENQVYPDYSLSFCQLSMSMASRRFKIVPSLASKRKYTQDKAKTCNCSQVDGIGGWEGGKVVGWRKAVPHPGSSLRPEMSLPWFGGLNLEQFRQCHDWAKLSSTTTSTTRTWKSLKGHLTNTSVSSC